MKNKDSNFRWKLYAVLFVLLFAVHMVLPADVGDDAWFYNIGTQMKLADFIAMRYEVWTSRLLIEAVMMTLLQLPHIVWAVTDSLMAVLLIHCLIELIPDDKNSFTILIPICLFVIYPVYYFRSAGWYATTLNYLWPMATGFYVLRWMNTSFRNEGKPNPWQFAAMMICLVFTVNQEQMCALIFGFGLFGLLFSYVKNHRINALILISFAISVLGLLFMMLCPGNAVRTAQEMATWYPAYENYGLAEKAVLSILSTFSSFSYHKVFVIHLFLGLIIFLAYKTGNRKLTALSVIPFGGFGMLNVMSLINSHTGHSFVPVLAQFTGPVEGSVITGASLIYLVLVLAVFAVLVYVMFCVFSLSDFLFTGITVCAALCERFVMGFSPTVFASGDRTFLLTYLLFLFLDVWIICGIHHKRLGNSRVNSL